MLLHVDGRLENAKLPTDTKHPLILSGRHPLTRFIVRFNMQILDMLALLTR